MNRTPPRFATWLATHFFLGARRETVLGDLVEQFQEDRTRFWYWREVLLAISLGIMKAVQANWPVLLSWVVLLPLALVAALSGQLFLEYSESWLIHWRLVDRSDLQRWTTPPNALFVAFAFVLAAMAAAPARKRVAGILAYLIVLGWATFLVTDADFQSADLFRWEMSIVAAGCLGGGSALLWGFRRGGAEGLVISNRGWRLLCLPLGVWSTYILAVLTYHWPPLRAWGTVPFAACVWASFAVAAWRGTARRWRTVSP